MKTSNDKNQKVQTKDKKIPSKRGHKKFPENPDYPNEDVITNADAKLPSESADNSDSSNVLESNDATKRKDGNLTDSEVATQKP